MGRFFGKKGKEKHEEAYGDDDIDEQEVEIPVPLPTKNDTRKPVTNQGQQPQQRIIEVNIDHAYLNDKLNLILNNLQALSEEIKLFKEEALK